MNPVTVQTLEILARTLPLEQQLELVARIAENLRRVQLTTETPKDSTDFYGAWRGKFPEDADIEADLAETRGEWLKEFEEFGL